MTTIDSTLDPHLAAALAEALPLAVPIADLTPDQARQAFVAAVAALNGADYRPEPVGRTEDLLVPGTGGDIPVRIYVAADVDPTAVIVYFHGGGFMTGDIDTHDRTTRRICVATGATVISVHYRLSPEHPFPAGFDDSYDVTVWAAERFPDLPLLVAGDSAGGCLSACVALKARDVGAPRIAGQVLIYPGVNADLETPTMISLGQGEYGLNLPDLATMIGNYLPNPADRESAYALPGNATSLHDLPPAIVTSAGFDPLLSSNEEYAARLREAGVAVVYQPHPTLIHGWTEFVGRSPAAADAVDQLTAAIADLIKSINAQPASA